jgi:hypothetical protein
VEDVEFFLGTRSVCTDTTDPYTCLITPQGDEVGVQTLRAVVTDSVGQTAEDAVPVTVEKFDPDDLTITMQKQRINRNRVTRTIAGELLLPDGVTAEQGCDDGDVTLTVVRKGLTIFPSSQVNLEEDCTYSLEFTIKERKGKKFNYDVDAAFSGNDVLNPIESEGGFN